MTLQTTQTKLEKSTFYTGITYARRSINPRHMELVGYNIAPSWAQDTQKRSKTIRTLIIEYNGVTQLLQH